MSNLFEQRADQKRKADSLQTFTRTKDSKMLASDQMVCDMVDAGCQVAESKASWLQERAIESAQSDMKTTDLPSTRQGFNAILQAAAKYGCKLVASDGSVVTF